MRKTIRAVISGEMYCGAIFPPANQSKTIHDELTTYLLPEQT